MSLETDPQSLYETDYLRWIESTLEKLRQQDYAHVDWDNLIDEIEDMSKSERRTIFTEAYRSAVKQAKAETGLPLETFPVECPYSVAIVLDDDFLPA